MIFGPGALDFFKDYTALIQLELKTILGRIMAKISFFRFLLNSSIGHLGTIIHHFQEMEEL